MKSSLCSAHNLSTGEFLPDIPPVLLYMLNSLDFQLSNEDLDNRKILRISSYCKSLKYYNLHMSSMENYHLYKNACKLLFHGSTH